MLTKITFEDFPNICRLCLNKKELTNIFQTPSLISTCNVITNLKIKEDDYLPKNFCHSCFKKLEDISDFIDMCKTNNDLLSAIALQEEDKTRAARKILDIMHIKMEGSDEKSLNDDDEDIYDCSKNEIDDSCCLSLNSDYDNTRLNESSISNKVTKNKILACKFCGKNCSSSNQLAIHLRTHTGIKPFKCEICLRRFATRNALSRHKLIHQAVKPHKCSICDWSGRNNSELLKHEQKHVGDIIEYKFNKVTDEHAEKKWKCLNCSKMFTRKFDLQLHLRIHSGFKPHQCMLCERKFTQKHTLIRHVSSVHAKDHAEKYTVECYICERKFIRKDHLEAHITNLHIKKQTMIAKELNSTKCTLCDKNFSLKAYLGHHLTVVHELASENKPKRIRPKIRNIRFTTTSNLCPFCGISFEKRKTYQTHMSRKHSTKEKKPPSKNKPKVKKEYQCWHCGKIFNTHCNLKVHVRTHTGEKPYECKFCHLRFSAWNSWHEHENIHTGAKPYQCELCKKGFRHRSGLRKHMKSAIHRK